MSKKKIEDNGKIPKNQGRDPMTYVFWGVALIIYGAYTLYISERSPYKGNLLTLYIIHSLFILFFGVGMFIKGIKDERDLRKRARTGK